MGFWKNLLPPFIFNPVNNFRRDYLGTPKRTYSGEGEDLILKKFFGNKRDGVFVDVGCYHPKVGSNTHIFYKNGWHGINIDPNPLSIKLFNKLRKRDINLNVGVSSEESQLRYFMFEEPAINTFSETQKISRIEGGQKFIGEMTIPTLKLSTILDRHFKNQQIDILDIDVEGFDLDVLKSNNWEKYKPTVIMVEDQDDNVTSFEQLETYKFLKPLGYQLICKTVSTLIFKLK